MVSYKWYEIWPIHHSTTLAIVYFVNQIPPSIMLVIVYVAETIIGNHRTCQCQIREQDNEKSHFTARICGYKEMLWGMEHVNSSHKGTDSHQVPKANIMKGGITVWWPICGCVFDLGYISVLIKSCYIWSHTVHSHYTPVSFLQNTHKRHLMRVTYGLYFVSTKYDLCSTLSCYNSLCYTTSYTLCQYNLNLWIWTSSWQKLFLAPPHDTWWNINSLGPADAYMH